MEHVPGAGLSLGFAGKPNRYYRRELGLAHTRFGEPDLSESSPALELHMA